MTKTVFILIAWIAPVTGIYDKVIIHLLFCRMPAPMYPLSIRLMTRTFRLAITCPCWIHKRPRAYYRRGLSIRCEMGAGAHLLSARSTLFHSAKSYRFLIACSQAFQSASFHRSGSSERASSLARPDPREPKTLRFPYQQTGTPLGRGRRPRVAQIPDLSSWHPCCRLGSGPCRASCAGEGPAPRAQVRLGSTRRAPRT